MNKTKKNMLKIIAIMITIIFMSFGVVKAVDESGNSRNIFNAIKNMTKEEIKEMLNNKQTTHILRTDLFAGIYRNNDYDNPSENENLKEENKKLTLYCAERGVAFGSGGYPLENYVEITGDEAKDVDGNTLGKDIINAKIAYILANNLKDIMGLTELVMIHLQVGGVTIRL